MSDHFGILCIKGLNVTNDDNFHIKKTEDYAMIEAPNVLQNKRCDTSKCNTTNTLDIILYSLKF